MNVYSKLGMFFFIIGALLSVLDSTFPFEQGMRGAVYVVLIFTGIFAGILNVTEDEEHHFLVSAAAFLIIILAFSQIFQGEHYFLDRFTQFFQNAVAFVGSMALVVALKIILEFGSDDYRVSPTENMEARTEEMAELQLSKGMKAWNFVIFLAVALTFLTILVEVFFIISPGYQTLLNNLTWLITVVFLIDLFVLFRREGSLKAFFKNCWLDVIAAIPFGGALASLKAVRLARFAKIAKATASLKFFSDKSGVNSYLRKMRKQEDEKVVVDENPRLKAKPKKAGQ